MDDIKCEKSEKSEQPRRCLSCDNIFLELGCDVCGSNPRCTDCDKYCDYCDSGNRCKKCCSECSCGYEAHRDTYDN